MNTVSIYRSRLLPLSQTFILEQARALRCWKPVFLGDVHEPGGLALDNIEVDYLRHTPITWAGQCRDSYRYWLQRPNPRAVIQLRQRKAKLVHAHFATDAVEIWPSVVAAGLPMLVTLHGYDINTDRDWWERGHGGPRKRLYPSRLLAIAKHADVNFIAVSESVRARAIAYGLPREKISVCYVGVDTSRFRPAAPPVSQRRRRLLYVGRMVEKKAPLQLIMAYANIHQQRPDTELVMIGDGPLRAAAESLANSLALPVVFTGALPSEQVLQHLHQARVFCLPSITSANGDAEGLPISIIEALACGVPAVTSARGGVNEAVIDGHNGYTVPENDPDVMAERLLALLQNDAVAEQMSQQARHTVLEQFDLSACTSRLEAHYLASLNATTTS